MKKVLSYLVAFLVGVVATLLIVGRPIGKNGMIFFKEAGESLSTNRFEVSRVVDDHCALAYELVYDAEFGYMSSSLLALVTNDDGEYYYDGQILKVSKGKCMRQVGVYRYKTKADEWKTVPIVKLMDI